MVQGAATSVDVGELVGPPGLPGPLYDPAQTDEHGRVDWVKLSALVAAVDALLSASLTDQARPLVRELRALVEAAQGPRAVVVDLRSERARRET